MIRPIKVTALPGYKIRVIYADGLRGVADLSDVAGKGVLMPLKDKAF